MSKKPKISNVADPIEKAPRDHQTVLRLGRLSFLHLTEETSTHILKGIIEANTHATSKR